MKASEVRGRTTEVLKENLEELYQTRFKLRMQGRTGQSFKYDQLKSSRRDIARILTVLNERARTEKNE